MLAIEANDEWLVGRSYISRESMTALYASHDNAIEINQKAKEDTELLAA